MKDNSTWGVVFHKSHGTNDNIGGFLQAQQYMSDMSVTMILYLRWQVLSEGSEALAG